MVMAVSGFSAGQSVLLGDVAAILTYFNRSYERQKPDGKARFLFANLSDEPKLVEIVLAVTYNTDFFGDWVRFSRNLPPRSLQTGELAREQFKTATFAQFYMVIGKPANEHLDNQINISGWPNEAPLIEASAEHFLKDPKWTSGNR